MEKKEWNKNRPQNENHDGRKKRYDSRPGYGADRGNRSGGRYDPDRKPASYEDREDEEDTGLVLGRNAVRELLKSGRPVDKLYVAGREGSIVALVAEAKKQKGNRIGKQRQMLMDNKGSAIVMVLVAIAFASSAKIICFSIYCVDM